MKDLMVKVDDVGRVVIPKKVRKHLDIKYNDLLLLSIVEDSIIIKKDESSKDLNKLIDKINIIKEKFDFDFLIANDYKIVYSSFEKEKYENFKINKFEVEDVIFSNNTNLSKDYVLTKPHYYCSLSFDNYTDGRLFLIFSNEKYLKEANLIINLLR